MEGFEASFGPISTIMYEGMVALAPHNEPIISYKGGGNVREEY